MNETNACVFCLDDIDDDNPGTKMWCCAAMICDKHAKNQDAQWLRIRRHLTYNGCPQCRRTKNPLVIFNDDFFSRDRTSAEHVTLRMNGDSEKITLSDDMYEKLREIQINFVTEASTELSNRLDKIARLNIDVNRVMWLPVEFQQDASLMLHKHVLAYEYKVLNIVRRHITLREEKSSLQRTVLRHMTDRSVGFVEFMQQKLHTYNMSQPLFWYALGDWIIYRNKKIKRIIQQMSFCDSWIMDKYETFMSLTTGDGEGLLDFRTAPNYDTTLNCQI